jgi:phosphoadenosine phosphosulfate reductase
MSEATTTSPSAAFLEELDEANGGLEFAPAGKAISWALDRFGDSMALACSFQDIVIVDLVHAESPGIEVVFLDTGAHFDETLRFVDQVTERYDLNLTVTHPGPEADAFPCGSHRCCEFRKVGPLRRALAGREAWMTGLKRVDAPTRAATRIVEWDSSFGLVKVNPLAAWTDDDIAGYVADHGLPEHPLTARGYLSIGCAPTTRPVDPGEDPRAGRWSGSDKTECGLHP